MGRRISLTFPTDGLGHKLCCWVTQQGHFLLHFLYDAHKACGEPVRLARSNILDISMCRYSSHSKSTRHKRNGMQEFSRRRGQRRVQFGVMGGKIGIVGRDAFV